MAIKTVLPAFPFFVNEDGEALEGGYIFIGMPGFEARSTPKASWFDLAQAIPTGTAAGAAIRTTAGYPRLNGGAANIYVDGDYSMTVTDRNGVVVYAVTTNNVQLGLGLGTVSVLNTGIAAGEVRTNAQNEALFLKITDLPPASVGLLRQAAALPGAQSGGSEIQLTGLAAANNPTMVGFMYPNPVVGQLQTRFRHLRVTQASSASSISQLQFGNSSSSGLFLGDVTLGGGFDMSMRVGVSDGAATSASLRARFGAMATGSGTDVEPSSILNSFLFGWDSADTNCQIMHRGAGAVTKIDLGVSFPVPATNLNNFYEVRFYSPNNETNRIYYTVTNLLTAVIATGNFVHASVAATKFYPNLAVSAGGVATSTGFAFGGLTITFND